MAGLYRHEAMTNSIEKSQQNPDSPIQVDAETTRNGHNWISVENLP